LPISSLFPEMILMSSRVPLAAVAGILGGLQVLLGPVAAQQTPAKPDTAESLQPILANLGVTLRVRERPRWPQPPSASVAVTLIPQGKEAGRQVVSFGLPFGPDVLADDQRIRVIGADGKEI